MHFKDKIAILTGGGSGIGKEAAKHLLAHGALRSRESHLLYLPQQGRGIKGVARFQRIPSLRPNWAAGGRRRSDSVLSFGTERVDHRNDTACGWRCYGGPQLGLDL